MASVIHSIMMFRRSFQGRVLRGFIISMLLVIGVGVIAYNNINKLEDNGGWVNHTYRVIASSSGVLNTVLNAETSTRGYVATGASRYLAPYEQATVQIFPQVDKLQELVRDNPKQYERVDSLRYYVNLKASSLRETINLREKAGYEAAKDYMLTDKGKIYTTRIRQYINELIKEENRLLDTREAETKASASSTRRNILIGIALILIIITTLFFFIIGSFKKQKQAEEKITLANTELEKLSAENERQNWLLTGSSELNDKLRGENEVAELAANIISSVAHYTHAEIGALYLFNKEKSILDLSATYAYPFNKKAFDLGQGLVGQVASEKKISVIRNVPDDYVKISSGIGESKPKNLLFAPFLFNNELKGVIELGFLKEVDNLTQRFISMVAEDIAIAVEAAQARATMQDLYRQTQHQAEELESQQEELRITNEELSKQTHMLQSSEEELKVQQEELRQINAELEEKASLLEEKNQAIEEAREAVSLKVKELEQTSRYKSEFLANMSHELRTPLNSILILAKMLNENKKHNLNEEEVKYANVIYNAGNDLLTLINDLLDLAKIESGKLDLHIEDIQVSHIKHSLEMLFTQLAQNKKIKYTVNIDEQVPKVLITDKVRVEQVIRNLLSNAFKFTPENGSVTVNIFSPDKDTLGNTSIRHKDNIIAIAVKDSGIGIPAEKQNAIFEAFQQADGSTNRKYGGTGLGLSISKELATMLGGEIQLQSEPGIGSTFTLFIPAVISADDDNSKKQDEPINVIDSNTKAFFREPIYGNDTEADTEEKNILIIEDDHNFAGILQRYAQSRGFKAFIASTGEDGLEYVKTHKPQAILLDIALPGMDGWEVLKKLKADDSLRQIPVHIMSASDEKTNTAKAAGAEDFIQKPVKIESLDSIFNALEPEIIGNFKDVLIIEDQELDSAVMRKQLENQDLRTDQAFSGKEALQLLDKNKYDAIILDLQLPDINGLDLLDKIKSDERFKNIPVIVNTASQLSQQAHEQIAKHTNAVVIKTSRSNNRLLDEITLFLNKVHTNQPDKPTDSNAGKSKNHNFSAEKALKNKTILVVDDDMRNVFSLSSALQQYDLKLETANNGKEALRKLDENPKIDLVLMDIMMPEMDGYEAMRAIRSNADFAGLPIIALTAKAMKNDRDKCIDAGANDYITKPVDVEKLISLIRVWLSK